MNVLGNRDNNLPKMMLGAKRMMQTSGVVAGQHVVIHVDDQHDNEVVTNLVVATREAGASAEVVRTATWDKLTEPEPQALRDAVLRADVLIGQGEYLRAELPYLTEARLTRGMLFVNNEAKTPRALQSSYAHLPSRILAIRGGALAQALVACRRVRITTASGTDITFSVRPETIGGYWYPYDLDGPGHKKGWPGGILCFAPDSADGTVCLTRLAASEYWSGGPRSTVLNFEISGGRVVSVAGSGAQDIEEHWRTSDGGARQFAKVLLGLHPDGESAGARQASSPKSVNFGFGDTTRYGGTTFSRSWVQGFDDNPTVFADDQLLYEAGRWCVDLPEETDFVIPPAPETRPLSGEKLGVVGKRLKSAIEAVADVQSFSKLPKQVHDIDVEGEPVFSVTTGEGPATIAERLSPPALLRSDRLLGNADVFASMLDGRETMISLLSDGRLRLAARLYGGSALTGLLTLAARNAARTR